MNSVLNEPNLSQGEPSLVQTMTDIGPEVVVPVQECSDIENVVVPSNN